MTQPEGFNSLNGTGTGFVEVLLNVGNIGGSVTSSWLTPCPDGSRVDGYQIVKGGLIYQIRPRCSCENCGRPSHRLNTQHSLVRSACHVPSSVQNSSRAMALCACMTCGTPCPLTACLQSWGSCMASWPFSTIKCQIEQNLNSLSDVCKLIVP